MIAMPVGLLLAPSCLAAAAWCARSGTSAARAAEVHRRLGRPPAPRRTVGVVATLAGAAHWRDARPWRWMVGGAALALAGAAVGGAFGFVVASAVAAAAGLVGWAHRLGAGARYDGVLIDVVDELARQLRSGAGVLGALPDLARGVTGPVRDDLDRLVARCAAGSPLADALAEWSQRRPRTAVRLVAGAIGLGVASGGLRARVVDELAQSLRRRDQARRDAVALSGQAQLSAVVMTAAPLAFAVLLAAGDAAARDFLLRAPAGLACLAAGLALDLAAAAWMVRLSAGAS